MFVEVILLQKTSRQNNKDGSPINSIIKATGLQNIILDKIETCENELKYKIYCHQDRNFCRCNHCDGPLGSVHEWKDRIIRGPPVGAFVETIIYLKQLRAHCYFCDDKVRSALVDFVHPNFQNMTMALCELAGRLMEEMTCEAVAHLLRLNPKTMWDLDQVRMRMMKPILVLPENINLNFMNIVVQISSRIRAKAI